MNIIPIGTHQIPKAVNILVNAFKDDPMFVYVFKTQERYNNVAPRIFSAWVKWAMKYGIAGMTENEAAVILLRKIGPTDMSMAEMVRTGFLLSPFELGAGIFKRFYMEMARALERKHSEIMGDSPHWYIWMLGVSNKRQGLGSLLLQYCVDIANKDGLPVFLETSVSSNILFYNTQAFELKDKMHHAKGKCPFYFMVKPATSLPKLPGIRNAVIENV